MKINSGILRTLFSLAFLSFSLVLFGQNFDPTPWVKKKIRAKAFWYESKGMDNLEKYDWSDAKMNKLLGDYEGANVRKKAFKITGFIGLGIGSFLLANGLSIEKKTCNTNDFWIGCELEQDARRILLTSGGINATIGLGFITAGANQKQKADEALVKIMVRHNELGL